MITFRMLASMMYTAASRKLSRSPTSSPQYGTSANSAPKSTISAGKMRRGAASSGALRSMPAATVIRFRPPKSARTPSGARQRENAAWKRHQNDDEQRELDDRGPAHRHERRRQALDQAERDAAQQGSGRIAEPAQHGHDEALELVARSRQDREREQGGDQSAGRAGQRDADPERHG